MAFSDRFSGFTSTVQQNIKMRLIRLFTDILRWASGLTLGLTISLIGQEMLGYQTVLFIFVILVINFLFLKVSRNWSIVFLCVFDLICVLLAMLLRMYILIAPGSVG